MYKIVKSECLADKIYLMDVEAPRIARACQPGEFVIVKMDEVGERIPLTICDYDLEWGLVTSIRGFLPARSVRSFQASYTGIGCITIPAPPPYG